MSDGGGAFIAGLLVGIVAAMVFAMVEMTSRERELCKQVDPQSVVRDGRCVRETPVTRER